MNQIFELFAFDVITVHVKEMASLQLSKGLIFMALPQESQGKFENEGFQVQYTGVGKIKATFTATRLLEKYRPEWVLNPGTAGSRKIEKGQIVECKRFVQRDFMMGMPPELKTRFAPQVFEGSSDISFGLTQVTCGSGDFIEQGDPLVDCDIFDMEAYSLAYVCNQFKTKFYSLKYISDASDENLMRDWKLNLKSASQSLLEKLKNTI
jgi:adenosylhomocysteine nucleosidase